MIPLQYTRSRFFDAGFLIATLVLAVVFYFAYQKIQLLSESSNMMTHTQGVRLALSQISDQVQETTLLHRQFLINEDSALLEQMPAWESDIARSLRQLDSMTRSNPIQQQNLDSLRRLITMDLVLMRKVTRTDFQNMTPAWMENRSVFDSIRALVNRMDQVEAGLLIDREVSREKSMRMAPFFAFLLLLLGLSIIAFSYLRIRKDLQRSRRQLEINLENTKKIVQLNETLQQAEQISQTGNWRMNLHTGARQYSSNVYRLMGYEPDSFEPVLDNWVHLVHPDDRKLVIDFAERTRTTTSDPAPIVYRFTRHDGQLRYFSASGRIVTDAAGEQTLIGTIQDITDSHQLRTELEERILFTEALLDNLVDGVSAFDQDLRVLTMNTAGESFFQKSKAEVIGLTIPDLFPGVQNNPEIINKFRRALQGETVQFSAHYEVAGIEKTLDIFYIPFYRPNKEVFGVLAIARDVSEAHRLRRELEERTRFAELLIESSVDMIAVYDKELRYTVWNQRCVEILHLPKEAVLGKNVFEVFPTMRGQKITQSLYKGLEGQSTYLPPQPSVLSNHHYENYVQPLFNEAGQVHGVLTVTHDVTESYRLREELEERSRFAEMIIESSVDIIVTYDTSLRITAWNKKSEEVFQLKKEDVLGKYVQDIFPHIAGTQRLTDLQAVLAGKTVQYEPEELHPYGIHANLYLLPLKDHSGEVNGVLSISHDVTDVVRSAAQLATLNRSLENKNQELANTNAELASFSYVASHDLQEPLRKIQAFGSRILANESERLSETGKDAFRRMQSAADRMQQLIEDLLTYSRTNTEPGEFAVQDLNKILQEAEMEVSEVITGKQAVIEADPLPNARVVAFQFRQLLTNLLSNALKYQRPDVVPHIRITCAIVSATEVPQAATTAERYYCIAVQDNGIGFEQQYAERIFELFQRLHGRSDYKGTGIGLAICRKIMQNHHGYLLAEGRPDVGSTFTIYLPV